VLAVRLETADGYTGGQANAVPAADRRRYHRRAAMRNRGGSDRGLTPPQCTHDGCFRAARSLRRASLRQLAILMLRT
jgi:hypothetical protein